MTSERRKDGTVHTLIDDLKDLPIFPFEDLDDIPPDEEARIESEIDQDFWHASNEDDFDDPGDDPGVATPVVAPQVVPGVLFEHRPLELQLADRLAERDAPSDPAAIVFHEWLLHEEETAPVEPMSRPAPRTMGLRRRTHLHDRDPD